MKIRVADEVWIATALLHRRHPDQDDFTVGEIVRQAEAEKVADGPLRAGIQSHAYQHCVANGVGVSRVYGGPDRFAAFALGTPASPAQLQSIAEAGRPSRRVGYEIRILGV